MQISWERISSVTNNVYGYLWTLQENILSVVFVLLNISAYFLKIIVWTAIFSISVFLNFLGFCFLVLILIMGQIKKMFEPRPPSRRRFSNSNRQKRAKSQDLWNSDMTDYSKNMEYDSVIRAARGLYTWRGGYTRPRFSCPDYWGTKSFLDYDSCYYTDSPNTQSEYSFGENWSPIQPRFRQPLL